MIFRNIIIHETDSHLIEELRRNNEIKIPIENHLHRNQLYSA